MIDKMNTIEFRCTLDEDQSFCEVNRMVKGQKQFITEIVAEFLKPKQWYDVHINMKRSKFKVYIKANQCMNKKYIR